MDPFDAAAIRGAATEEFWIITTLVVGGALAALVKGLSNIRLARLVEDTPTALIRSAPQGYVEIAGTSRAWLRGAITAPLTGTPCVWYSYRVERRRKRQWRTVRAGRSDAPFLCDDGTGIAALYPAGAAFHVANGRSWQGAGERYTENLLGEGEDVYVLGEFRTAASPIVELPPAIDPMPGMDGVPARVHQPAPGVIHAVARPARSRLPFIVSSRLEDTLAPRLRRFGWLCLGGFLVAGALAAYLLSARLAG